MLNNIYLNMVYNIILYMGGGLMGMIRSGYYDCIINLKQPMYNAFPTDKNMHIRMILHVINDYENFQHKHYIYALQEIYNYM